MESLNTDTYFKFNPNTLQKIRKAYNLDQPGVMSDAVDILEEWLKKQEHFVKKDFDRDYLERTIIRAKGSVDKSKQRLDKLCSARTLMSNFFSNANIRDFTHLDMIEDVFLPQPTTDNYRVYILRNTGQDFDENFFININCRTVQYIEYQYANDYCNGIVTIYDFRETNLLPMVKYLDLVIMRNMLKLVLDCYGVPIKGIHLISTSKAIEILVGIFKQALSTKLGNRIHVHKDLESLYRHVEIDILPSEYGGKQKLLTELHQQFLDELSSEKHASYRKMMNAACTNEAYRQTDKFNEQCLGMPGTFRTLRVD